MRPTRITLPDQTVESLGLSYTPYCWDQSEEFPGNSCMGFSLQEPWQGDEGKNWYAEAREPFDQLQRMLSPYDTIWVELYCTAALVPGTEGSGFACHVNGIVVSDELDETDRLVRLMRQRNMKRLVTTCRAQISGGGLLPDGTKRGYSITLDFQGFKELDVLLTQRKRERVALFKCFRFLVLEHLAKQRFFALFDDQCFACGSVDELVMDHHVPIVRGGHFVPGNLVALCTKCNNQKGTKVPEVFYSPQQLAKLQPLLEQQAPIFTFVFNWDAWNTDCEAYLIALGVEPELAHQLLEDPEHRYYIKRPEP